MGKVREFELTGKSFSLHEREELWGARSKRSSRSSELAEEELVGASYLVRVRIRIRSVYFEVLHLEREVISTGQLYGQRLLFL